MKRLKLPLLNTNTTESEYGSINRAYQDNNVELSRNLHENKEIEDYHNITGSDILKSIIFGGLDGIITSFAMISSSHASHLPRFTILLLGISNIIAGAISMGHGDYFSEKAESEYILDQYNREKWEFENFKECEIKEMKELYTVKYNVSEEDAEIILIAMANYDKLFLDHMMVVELGLMPPDDDSSPICNGLATFTSFIIFGSIPLISYLVSGLFWISCIFSVLTLAVLGGVKSTFTRANCIYSSIITIVNGIFSAGTAYLVVWGLTRTLNQH